MASSQLSRLNGNWLMFWALRASSWPVKLVAARLPGPVTTRSTSAMSSVVAAWRIVESAMSKPASVVRNFLRSVSL